MTDLFRRQSTRLSEAWLLFGQCWMIFRALGEPSRPDACARSAARFNFFLILNSCFSDRCFIQAHARGVFEGCTKIPLKEPVLRLLKSQTFSRRVWPFRRRTDTMNAKRTKRQDKSSSSGAAAARPEATAADALQAIQSRARPGRADEADWRR